MGQTKINLSNNKVYQSTGETLNLSGNTIINALSATSFTILNQPTVDVDQNSVLVRDSTTGEIKQVSQQNLDVQFDSLEVFYVDSNNPDNGDGSIINPFQTLNLAYNAVIGNGTANNPENQSITISVAGGSYSTGLNLAINTITWIFQDGSNINYTATGFLFDISVFGTANPFCNVYGNGNFETTNGAFINAEGTNISGTGSGRILRFSCNTLISRYDNGNVDADIKPLIVCSNPVGATNGQNILLIFSFNERILSFTQKIFKTFENARFSFFGTNPNSLMSVGTNSSFPIASNAYFFDIGSTFEAIISNFRMLGYNSDTYIRIGASGTTTSVGRIEVSDILVRTTSQTNRQAVRFLQIGDIERGISYTYTESRVIFKNIDYVENFFSSTTEYFQYIGANPTFENLELYNSRLPYPIDPKIILNANIITSASSPSGGVYDDLQAENTIGGKLNFSNITGSGTALVIDADGFVSRGSVSVDLSNYVTLDGTQTISGSKTFSSTLNTNTTLNFSSTNTSYIRHNGQIAFSSVYNSCTILYFNGGQRLRTKTDGVFFPSSNICFSNSTNFIKNGANNAIAFISNSCTQLYFNNSAKLRTVTNGSCIVGCGFATDFIASSDKRIKYDSTHFEDPISTIKNLCGKRFKRYDDDTNSCHIGFMAQEVELVLPEVVSTQKMDYSNRKTLSSQDKLYKKLGVDELKGIKYEKISAILVEGFKAQQTQIELLREELNKLKNK